MSEEKKIEIKAPKYTSYGHYPIYQCGCYCGASETKEVKEDCYFYSEQMDMGARIDTCSYNGTLGSCPCKDCKKYISNKETSQIIRGIVDGR